MNEIKYFKLIKDSSVIGVATSIDLCKSQKKHNIVIGCKENQAEFISCNSSLYHDFWMVKVKNENIEYEECSVLSIEESEFISLSQALALQEKLEIEEPEIFDDTYNEGEQSPEDTLVKSVNEYTERLNRIEQYMKQLAESGEKDEDEDDEMSEEEFLEEVKKIYESSDEEKSILDEILEVYK